jgi:hypothetical protein
MLSFYHSHLESNFNKSEFLIFKILIDLLQIHQWVRLECLADKFPLPIEFQSRRKKIQRFLSLKKLNIETLWHPILKQIIATYFSLEKTIYLVIDRTRWANVNILMISVLYKKRAIPVYFELLDKKGNSNLKEQTTALSKVMPLFKDYQKIVLGDREFCGVDLAKWLTQQEKTDFCLRIKKNVGVAARRVYIELNGEIKTLAELGLLPGMSVYYQGVKITKGKGFGPINLAAKWKKTYRKKKTKEPWFIMTSLESLQETTNAYSQRMGIEEMFRDFKKGGYNLESTGIRGERLLALVLLITFAYVVGVAARRVATFQGDTIQKHGITNYIGRTTEEGRNTRRHSRFYIGLHGKEWLESMEVFKVESELLMSLSPQKLENYQKGRRAATLVASAF